jgi:hypothetical protein
MAPLAIAQECSWIMREKRVLLDKMPRFIESDTYKNFGSGSLSTPTDVEFSAENTVATSST